MYAATALLVGAILIRAGSKVQSHPSSHLDLNVFRYASAERLSFHVHHIHARREVVQRHLYDVTVAASPFQFR
jgi:hypothetical protein